MELLPAFAGTPQSNKVYNVTAEVMLSALQSDSVDLVVTSPPYDNLRTYKGFQWDFEYIARQSYRVLKPGGVLVWVVGDSTNEGSESMTSFKQALYFREQCGFKLWDTMIWDKQAGLPHQPYIRYCQTFEYMFVFSKGTAKTSHIPTFTRTDAKKARSRRNPDGTMRRDISGEGGGAYPNVWRMNIGYNASDEIAHEHPAIFPEELARRHIESWSNPGDLVLDYFGGSGTTATEAQRLGRRYLTNDISREYCDLMEKRLAQPYTLPMFAQVPA